jgi:hypothetical protein
MDICAIVIPQKWHSKSDFWRTINEIRQAFPTLVDFNVTGFSSPRRIRLRVISPNQRSTRLSHELLVMLQFGLENQPAWLSICWRG